MNIVAITGMDLTSMQEQMPQDLKERCQFRWFKSSSEAGEHIADADVIITAGRLNPERPQAGDQAEMDANHICRR